MKKILLSITAALLLMIVPAKATDLDDIREYALFLTDKMAYELNLSEEQYEAAYEINFDYLYDMLRYEDFDDYDFDDLYGHAWEARNRDFKIILLSSQYNLYRRLKYFYRPFHRSHGRIVINIYNYYPQRDYLYFGCPNFVVTYRGGHGWRHHRVHSYYAGRPWHNNVCYGMRDGYRSGVRYYSHGTRHHGRHYDNNRSNSYRDHHRHSRDSYSSFRNSGSRGRVSSTRTTVKIGDRNNNRSRGSIDRSKRLPDNMFTPGSNRRNNNSVVNRSIRNVNRKANNTENRERRGHFGGGR